MNLYCKVYLDTPDSKENVLNLLVEMTNGHKQLRTVISTSFEVDVSTNEDFDDVKREEVDDGFLYYRYYLDIVPTLNATEADYINAISELMSNLRKEKLQVMASCDFEDQLSKLIK